MKTYLKIKIMSLAAETRIVRREEKRWVAAKNGDELYAALSGVVSRKLGREIKLG